MLCGSSFSQKDVFTDQRMIALSRGRSMGDWRPNKSLDASGGSVKPRQKEKGKRKKKSRRRVNSPVRHLLGHKIGNR